MRPPRLLDPIAGPEPDTRALRAVASLLSLLPESLRIPHASKARQFIRPPRPTGKPSPSPTGTGPGNPAPARAGERPGGFAGRSPSIAHPRRDGAAPASSGRFDTL